MYVRMTEEIILQVKRITHTPEVLSQFLALNLNAPTTMAEVLASLEQLRARRVMLYCNVICLFLILHIIGLSLSCVSIHIQRLVFLD